jgi:hypothetical protein
MRESAEWYVKAEDGNVYGPACVASLAEWAKEGRIQPTSSLSRDRVKWLPAPAMPELEMKWLVEPEPGRVFGPFNRAFVIRLFKDGSASPDAKVYSLHELPVDEDPPPKVVERVVEKEVRVEVPVERVVEKIVEVPVEKVVERVVEKEVRVEVPVEKIVERVVEKVVEVPAPRPRTQSALAVVPEVLAPAARRPLAKMPGGIFAGLNRARLMALEAAAQQELAKRRRFGLVGSLFGRKH